MKLQKQINECRTALKKVCDCTDCPDTPVCCNTFCTIQQAMTCLDSLEKQALERERSISAEKLACFQLGQKDMQASAADALRHAADKTIGNTRFALLIAADVVKELEVLS